MKKPFRKQTDERQEKEMLQIGNASFYIVWFALLVSICVQSIMRATFAQIAAELIIFFTGSICIIVGCIIKGQWDFFSQPTPRTYLLYSALTSVIGTGILAFTYDWGIREHVAFYLKVLAAIAFAVFAISFTLFAIAGAVVKTRRRILEEKYDSKR